MFKSTNGRLRDIMSTNDNEEIDMNYHFYRVLRTNIKLLIEITNIINVKKYLFQSCIWGLKVFLMERTLRKIIISIWQQHIFMFR